jgi:uncharacterized protein (UPF0335 family)
MKKLKLKDPAEDERVSPEERMELLGDATARVVDAIITKAVDDANTQGSLLNTNTVAKLRSYIERVERLKEEQKALGQDITEIMAEAKSSGFDTAVIKDIIKLRSLDDYAYRLGLLQTYAVSLGMEWPA